MILVARNLFARSGDSAFLRRHRSRANIGLHPLFSIRPIFCYSRATQEPITTRLSFARAFLTSCRRLPLSGGRALRLHSPLLCNESQLNHNNYRKRSAP